MKRNQWPGKGFRRPGHRANGEKGGKQDDRRQFKNPGKKGKTRENIRRN